jgi:Phage integrase family
MQNGADRQLGTDAPCDRNARIGVARVSRRRDGPLICWGGRSRCQPRPREDACHPSFSWMLAGDAGRPPPCRAFTKAEHLATRVSATRPNPPTVEEIIAVMHAAGDDHDAVRLRGLIIVLWRAGLRISEALALNESDLDLHRGAILVRRGKGGKRREVGMDRWAWEQLGPWLQLPNAAGRRSVLCAARSDCWSRVGTGGCPISAAPRCRPGGCATPVRASSAQTRPRGGDVARRRAAARHSTPTRAR